MNAKQDSTKNTRTRTGPRVKCPKCSKITLRHDGMTPGGKQRWSCLTTSGGVRSHCYTTTNPNAPYRNQASRAKRADQHPQFRRALTGVKRFIITTAQNATPVHAEFFESMKNYCDYNDAELVVIPIRYKNATSQWTQSQENAEHWLRDVGIAELAKKRRTQSWFYKNAHRFPANSWNEFVDQYVAKYLYNQRKKLNENLVLVGDMKTHPTATKPLSRCESVTLGESGIFGHTKIQMTVVPTPQGRFPKVLATTGACTVKNYTDSKAGKLGEFHHALAALVVEVVGKKFFMRHVNAMKDGSFIDLDTEYSVGGVSSAPPALALVIGDTHRRFLDRKVERCTFSKGGMVDTLSPETLVFHDLHDGYAENPHHFGNPFVNLAKRNAAMHLVKEEIVDDVKWLIRTIGKRKAIIVPSNHDNFLWRWIIKNDWRLDTDNAEFYLETALAMVKDTVMQVSGSATPDPFTYWVNKWKGKAPITCLARDESFVLGDVELSMHGDQGPNGSRGSRQNLRRIGVKSIIGHSHTPGIEEGCYQTGTSTPLKLEYNTGPSSWLQAHVILYANGKRAVLPIIDGSWRIDDVKG